MASLIPGFEYDIFISYRQNDNKYDGWITEFVDHLNKELEANIKDKISVYFDINPHDGLLETHSVDRSLEDKLKCLIFIPIISRTYCDSKCFAWQHEFCAFNKLAKEDKFGRDIRLSSRNFTSRILPVKIHDLDPEDTALLENELGGVLRSVEFIYKSAGVNRPLRANEDHPQDNLNKTYYRDQINKVANAVKEIIAALKKLDQHPEEDVKQVPEPKPVSKKNLKTRIISLALILLALVMLGYFIIPKLTRASTNTGKSIAVLPFKLLSDEPDKQYLADGMMEAILLNLSKIKDLRVMSSTSVEQYRGTIKTTRQIGKELGVEYILEGRFQKNGDNVRLIVQLINAREESHAWAEEYDRNWNEVFSVQSEVAQKIASSLKARISTETRRLMDVKPTNNSEAYDLYLKSNKLDAYNEKENKEAIELLEKAIALDPDFSSAYGEIGYRLTTGATFLAPAGGMDPQNAWQTAKPFFEKALALNPDDGDSHNFMAWGLLWYKWDFEGARKEYEETKRIFPNYSWTDFLVASGQFEEAYRGAMSGVEVDSRDFISWAGMLISAYFANKDPEGVLRKVLSTPVVKDNIYVRSEAARVYLYLKDYQQANAVSKQLLKDFPDVASPRMAAIQAISSFKLNRPDETARIIEELKLKSETNAGGSPSFYLGMIYAEIGEKDNALVWLGKGFQNHEIEFYWMKVEPPFESLRGDPRYQAMLDKIGYPK